VKLRAAGWIVATGSVVFWLTSGAVTLVTRNAMDLYREMEVPAQHIAAVQRMPGFTTFIQAFTLVIQLALLVALIWSKRYFGSPPQSTAASFSASAPE
jgi:hypothetical protein